MNNMQDALDALHLLVVALKGKKPSRELSLAVTKLEEAIHWLQAVKE